jgi:transglutaminase-like putative cysteine protease
LKELTLRLALFWALYLFVLPALAFTPELRVINFHYDLLPQDFPTGEAVDIYIPLPTDVAGQIILLQTLQTSVPGRIRSEDVHGNTYYHLHRPAGDNTPLSASLHWTVARQTVGAYGAGALTPAQRAKSLAPDRLVPVNHEILEPILAEIHAMRADASPQATARAIYDWVVDNVEYKKVGTGWGNGDTFWACSERYGNCTDFHALLISLARTEGIPARFEIGFPIPVDSEKGKIGGYHCWVHLYLPERGWVPMDASEASKYPEKRERFFGGQPADRIHFTVGRDLVVSPASANAPLNYFIYPYVEIGGRPWTGDVDVRFSFEEELPEVAGS